MTGRYAIEYFDFPSDKWRYELCESRRAMIVRQDEIFDDMAEAGDTSPVVRSGLAVDILPEVSK